jgi:hypothetical protein
MDDCRLAADLEPVEGRMGGTWRSRKQMIPPGIAPGGH